MKKYLIPIILAILFLSFFLYQKISPFGFSCEAKLLKNDYFILGRSCLSIASPKERREIGDNLVMKGDPLYFSLYSPRKFNNLDLEIVFRPEFDAEVSNISLGLLVNKELWQYDLQSIYNQAINNYENYYPVYEEPLLLLQKKEQFKSIDDWLIAFNDEKNPLCPDKEMHQCLALENLNVEQKRLIKPYYNFPSLELNNIDINLDLKGRHSFFLYLEKDDSLDLSLAFSSLKNDEEVLVEILKDDYSIYRYQENSLEDLNLNLNNLGAGVYEVNIAISDDIFIERIKTKARALVFKNRFWPNTKDSLSLITNGNKLNVKLLKPANRQEIIFAGQKYNIDELFVQHKFQTGQSDAYAIELEQGALLLENDAYFALEKKLLFNPGFAKLGADNKVDFVLVNYVLPDKLDDNIFKARVSFNLSNVFYQENLYNFIISIPGLRAEDASNNKLIIESIKFNFYDDISLWDRIFKLVN
jgi:hypothetical protein